MVWGEEMDMKIQSGWEMKFEQMIDWHFFSFVWQHFRHMISIYLSGTMCCSRTLSSSRKVCFATHPELHNRRSLATLLDQDRLCLDQAWLGIRLHRTAKRRWGQEGHMRTVANILDCRFGQDALGKKVDNPPSHFAAEGLKGCFFVRCRQMEVRTGFGMGERFGFCKTLRLRIR